MTQGALVQNAADPKQVRSARKREKIQRRREVEDIKWVMSAPPGRRFVWYLLSKFGVTVGERRSVLSQSQANMGWKSGMQDAGHEIEGDIVEADEEAYYAMIREARADRVAAIATSNGGEKKEEVNE